MAALADLAQHQLVEVDQDDHYQWHTDPGLGIDESFRRKDGTDQPPGRTQRERDVHKDKRSNETHASTTDPDAQLAKKAAGKEAKLAYVGHLLTENRHGLVVDARLTPATGPRSRQLL